MEEAKALICWEAIKDHLRNEEHTRSSPEGGPISPLDSLTNEQLTHVKEKYDKFTPFIRTIFIVMTFLALVWDVMLLVCTLYYFAIFLNINYEFIYNLFLGNYYLFSYNS